MDISTFYADPEKKIKLSKIDTSDTGKYKSKDEAEEKLQENIVRMAELQDMLYAQDKYSILIILQAMDTAGKDLRPHCHRNRLGWGWTSPGSCHTRRRCRRRPHRPGPDSTGPRSCRLGRRRRRNHSLRRDRRSHRMRRRSRPRLGLPGRDCE